MHREDGFTLLEVLVALVIAGIGLAALLGLTSSSLHLSGSAKRIALETAGARAVLERFGIDVPIVPGVLSGAMREGLRWRSDVQRLDRDASPDLPQPAVVTVTVWDEDAGDPGVRLTSVRLLPAATPDGSSP